MSSDASGERKVRSYQDLRVWQRGMDLTIAVYRATDSFPREEIYCLTSQLRRASISIPSNIAEGHGRSTRREYRHFLIIARSSNQELQTQLLIAERLGFGTREVTAQALAISQEVGRMLNALLLKLPLDPK